jgi:hypothetical protein
MNRGSVRDASLFHFQLLLIPLFISTAFVAPPVIHEKSSGMVRIVIEKFQKLLKIG